MPKLRLVTILRRHLADCRSYNNLAKEIEAANIEAANKGLTPLGATIDRRKLKQIVEYQPGGPGFSLSVKDLEILNNYLNSKGEEGFRDFPFFESENILHSLADKGKVRFFLSDRPLSSARLDRTYVATWDVRSLSEVIRGVNRSHPTTRFEVEEVPFRPHDQPPQPGELASHVDKEPDWSVCSIGGPLACDLTDYMLSEMFHVPPLEPRTSVSARLPFYIVPNPAESPELAHRRFPSQFVLTPEEFEPFRLERCDRDLPMAVRDKKAQALVFDEKVYPVRIGTKPGHTWNDYGLVVAQRSKERGQLWLALFGLSGPGTYGAAQILEKVEAMDWGEPGTDSRVLYAVVRVDVVFKDGQGAGDKRDVVPDSWELLKGPEYWP